MTNLMTVLTLGLQYLALTALYLACAGKLAAAEICAALVSAALAIALRVAILRRGRRFAACPGRFFLLLPRIGGAIARDALHLTLALARLAVTARQPPARFAHLAFDPGHGDAASRSRRAMVVTGISLGPNTYVVAVRRANGELVRHELLGATPPEDRQWPL